MIGCSHRKGQDVRFTRYAVYYVPDGDFAKAGAAWLGWDILRGCEVGDGAGQGMTTQAPARYGFHATIKAPFRLAPGYDEPDLIRALERFARSCPKARADGLFLANEGGELALYARNDAALAGLAGRVVTALDPFRAPLTGAERARRRPDTLTARQRRFLDLYGYPHVFDDYRFHMTLGRGAGVGLPSDPFTAAQAHFAPVLPQPFAVDSLALCGEGEDGRFRLISRVSLGG